MSPTVLLIVYGLFVLLASLAGGAIPLVVKLTHQRMQVAISFVAGVMLGVGVLHLLPHAIAAGSSPDRIFAWMLAGFLVMFFLERFFSFHHHDAPEELPEHVAEPHEHAHAECAHHDHGHPHAHHHGHGHGDEHSITLLGAGIGLTLHGLIDGIALAAAVEAESHLDHAGPLGLAGIGVFLGIALHLPFDAMSLGTLMAWNNRPVWARNLVNVLFACVIPLGALLFQLGISQFENSGAIIAQALGFSAGTFLCISLSDLLPELQFHRHDRIKLSAALLLGVGLAWALMLVEGSGHDHSRVHQEHGHDHDHHDHDHAGDGVDTIAP